MTLEIPEGRIATLKNSYIMGLFGDRGSGKSAVMTYYGIQDWKRGRRIIYYPETLGIKLPGAIGLSPLDLGVIPELLDGATILIDEIQELLSKYRTNSTLSLQLMSLFRQVRKRGANIIFTSNDPGAINRAVSDQTDMHATCQMLVDPRCYKLGWHRPGCQDTVRLRVKDTQGRHGLNKFRKDGRKGFVQHIVGISDVYPYYDTASIADLADVVTVTKTDLIEQKATETLGMTWDEFDDELRFRIGELVKSGGSTLTPKNFVKTLKDELGIPSKGPALAPTILGKHLTGIGLQAKRGNQGMIYTLPPEERLEEWVAGVWSPGDDD